MTTPAPEPDEKSAWDAIVADLSGELDLRAAHLDAMRPDVADSDDDRFVPPEPPPIPRPRDAVARFAWAGVLGGPALVFVAALLSLGRVLAAAGAIAFVAGFVTLIARKDDAHRHQDGWDDGAVV